MDGPTPSGTLTVQASDPERAVVELAGSWTLQSATPGVGELSKQLDQASNVKRVSVVGTDLTEWDTSVVTLLVALSRWCAAASANLDLEGLPEGIRRLFALATAVPERKGARRDAERTPWLRKVGERALAAVSEAHQTITFVGLATMSFGRFLTGRARYRRSELWVIIQQCGPEALPIVTTISLLVGVILAFVGAIQLQMFGADIFVANLVGMGMVIEMGALMTGIILAGRTGAAFAAQLGTMEVNEEIDALKTMGLDPIDYLVLPRMLSLALMTPLLALYANIVGILGGAAVGIFMLDIPTVLYFNQTIASMELRHVLQGLSKAAVFGVLIALSGCMRGMQCGRSASAVGDAATSAVVSGIVFIVVADAIITFMIMVAG